MKEITLTRAQERDWRKALRDSTTEFDDPVLWVEPGVRRDLFGSSPHEEYRACTVAGIPVVLNEDVPPDEVWIVQRRSLTGPTPQKMIDRIVNIGMDILQR